MLASEMAKTLNDLNPNYHFTPAMGDEYNAIGYVRLSNPSTIKVPAGWNVNNEEKSISKSTDKFVLMCL